MNDPSATLETVCAEPSIPDSVATARETKVDRTLANVVS
jgi:hypothetical protein